MYDRTIGIREEFIAIETPCWISSRIYRHLQQTNEYQNKMTIVELHGIHQIKHRQTILKTRKLIRNRCIATQQRAHWKLLKMMK